jgi:hypothetical protein
VKKFPRKGSTPGTTNVRIGRRDRVSRASLI